MPLSPWRSPMCWPPPRTSSFGDISGAEYVTQLTVDHIVHAWDLARATGGDERLDDELVELALDYLTLHAEEWRSAGVLGPSVPTPEGSGRQGELLALAGRQVAPL